MTAFSVPANLAFDSYYELVSGINDWLDRNDLTGAAQQMIALCEARLNRELAPYFNETSLSVVTVDGFGAFPADFGTLERVVYGTRALPQISLGNALDVQAHSEPYAFTIEAGQIRVWPAGNFTLTLTYRPRLVALSESSPNSDLLSAHPDLYFFGSLMFAHGYEANDSRAAMFKQLWDEAIDSARRYLTMQRFGSRLVPRPAWVP